MLDDHGRDRLLEPERRQGGDLRRHVVVARPLAPDRGDRQDEVADLGLLQAAALAQEQHGLGLDRREQVHHRRRHRAAHAEVQDRQVLGRRRLHRVRPAQHLHAEPLGEQVHVVVEVAQEDVLAESVQRPAGVARQPVLHDLGFRLHGRPLDRVNRYRLVIAAAGVAPDVVEDDRLGPIEIRLEEIVPRSRPGTTIRSSRQRRAAEAGKSRGSKVSRDEADPRVVGVVDVEVGHGVDAGRQLDDRDPPRAGRLDDEGGIRGRRSGSCSRRIRPRPARHGRSGRRPPGRSKPSRLTASRPFERV